MGVLVPIGEGKKPVSWAKSVLENGQRELGGVTAPPEGLYFINVDYPAHCGLPTVSTFPVVW